VLSEIMPPVNGPPLSLLPAGVLPLGALLCGSILASLSASGDRPHTRQVIFSLLGLEAVAKDLRSRALNDEMELVSDVLQSIEAPADGALYIDSMLSADDDDDEE